MELIGTILSFVFNIEGHLRELITSLGPWSYAALFAVVFSETGFVITPFLPGDSLLFAVGAFAAAGSFDLLLACIVLWAAAFLGDTVNYWIGHAFGKKIVASSRIPVNQAHIDRTSRFYAKYGAKTIMLARFVPIVRTFAPFVAGVGEMEYGRFVVYNAIGGAAWVFGALLAGYFFGNIPLIKDNFSSAVLAIIAISVVPVIYEMVKEKIRKSRIRKKANDAAP